MRRTRILSLFSLCVAATLFMGCGSENAGGEDGDDASATDRLYLASAWVADVDATNTYVAAFDSIEIEELDFASAIELPGYADSWVHGSHVFVAEGEAPVVRRYGVTEDHGLELDVSLSFANYGALSPAFYNNDILSDTVAYLSNPDQREYILWNPEAMEITGTVPWPELAFDEGLEPFHSYTDRGGSVVEGLYFHGIYGHNELFDAFGDKSYIIVHDIETHDLVDTIEVPCPMMDVSSVGNDGYLYVSGWSYMPLSILTGRSPTNCAARINLATRELDEAWTMTYPSLTGGDEASGLRVVEGTNGIVAVFHGSDVPVTDGIDIWDLDVAPDDWELYNIDLETKEMSPTGVLFSDGSYYETHIGERYFVYLVKGSYTQVFERTDVGYEPHFQSVGWLSRFFQLR